MGIHKMDSFLRTPEPEISSKSAVLSFGFFMAISLSALRS
jgi:hypothetical protein